MQNNNKKQKSLIKIFFKIVISIILVFLLFASAVVFAYNKIISSSQKNETNINNSIGENEDNNNNFVDAILGKGIKLNVAVFGVDKDETRTDVIFVVHFDSKKGILSLLSVPRDTRVTVAPSVKKIYDENNRYYKSPTKINSIHAYAGDKGPEAAVLQLEDLLGINIDHYIKVNINGFGEIIDAIGGVEFDVPQKMYWDMRDTGDMLINLNEGLQVLDGNKATQLIRFRRYDEGDIARVQVQQDFLKAAAKKILSTDSIIKNIDDYIKIFFKYVSTDINVLDAVKYAGYIKDINISNAQFETLPGEGKYIENISYYINDEVETQNVVDRLFYGEGVETENKSEIISSKDKLIEVSNGGNINGLAGRFKEKFISEGFKISKITTYDGKQVEYTRIIVPKENMGEDLKEYFEDARIEVNKNLIDEDSDIKIIIGTGEKG